MLAASEGHFNSVSHVARQQILSRWRRCARGFALTQLGEWAGGEPEPSPPRPSDLIALVRVRVCVCVCAHGRRLLGGLGKRVGSLH